MAKVVSLRPQSSAESDEVKYWLERYEQRYATGEEHTPKAKRTDLGHLRAFFERQRVTQMWQLAPRLFNRFVDERVALPEAPSTINRRVATTKHFLNWVASKLPGFDNPARDFKGVAGSEWRPRPKYLTKEEVEQLRLPGVDAPTFKDLRDNVLIELLMRCGLREFEAQCVTPKQLDFAANKIRRVVRKSRRITDATITRTARVALDLYLPAREIYLRRRVPALSLQGSSKGLASADYPLLLSHYAAKPGRPETWRMSLKSIYQTIKRRSGGKAHPHLLRHQLANDALEASGHNVGAVSKMLGHADISTTMRYLGTLEDQAHDIAEDLD